MASIRQLAKPYSEFGHSMVSGNTYGIILTPLVLSRIPQDIRLEWAREGEGRENNLNFLLEFLYKENERRERSQFFQKSKSTNPKKVIEQPQPSFAAFHTNSAVAGQGKHLFLQQIGKQE
ncbi:hypothetical protein PoB_001765100 [Plakobranchus ocellatus]|uniref:Uncharacterized protein n=1 Tax=Plakobranchus ocellatus TaxID=259542 RepID=A0AAV3YVK5_9GAST|nr:hypothetical protein PoB_001765100 [Plakobranchus ocellatus]